MINPFPPLGHEIVDNLSPEEIEKKFHAVRDFFQIAMKHEGAPIILGDKRMELARKMLPLMDQIAEFERSISQGTQQPCDECDCDELDLGDDELNYVFPAFASCLVQHPRIQKYADQVSVSYPKSTITIFVRPDALKSEVDGCIKDVAWTTGWEGKIPDLITFKYVFK